jgi:biotin carboxylase
MEPAARPPNDPTHAGRPVEVLTLFCYDWDAAGLARLGDHYRFHHEGFDLFTFPSNLRLLNFELDRFVGQLARRYAGRGLAAVLSHHEQFGALAAAMLARRLGLPGTPPEAIVRAQHKLICRQILDEVAPEANIPYALLACEYGQPPPENLHYPLFVKPVKAAYSVLARRIEDRAQLAAHIRFGAFETWIIKRLVEPFDRVARALVDAPVDAHRLLVEAPIRAPQFNLDGWVHRGRAHLLGVCDEIMYPDTQAFLRFAYPSRLPDSVQARALDVADRFLRAAGFDHGFFNMEFFHDPDTDALKVIEFNPRLASQLADLYLRVDGRDVHAMTLALARGEDPSQVPRVPARGGAAASFVFRRFDGRSTERLPTTADLAWLSAEFPDALLLTFAKQGSGLRREMKWLGSHRYAVMHLHGDDEADLRRRYEVVCARLGWPADY